jgi:hypothetical protein
LPTISISQVAQVDGRFVLKQPRMCVLDLVRPGQPMQPERELLAAGFAFDSDHTDAS